MVREVEARPRNYTDIVDKIYSYDSMIVEDPTSERFSGQLSDDGKTLDITLNINAPKGDAVAEIMLLDFNIVDFANKTFTSRNLTDLLVRPATPPTLKYTSIDLSEVLEIPQSAEKLTADLEASLRLFTYEANIETAYGSKRLSVPYKVDIPYDYVIANNTDGLYTVNYALVRLWGSTATYVPGQVTVDGTTAYTCLKTVSGTQPEDTNDYWRVATMDDIRAAASGITSGQESGTLIASEVSMIISRYHKQTILYDLVNSLSYREEDDIRALSSLNIVSRYHELCVLALEEANPIQARYFLNKMKVEHSHFTGPTNTVAYKHTL